jgi:hypothetical protein
MLRSRSISIMFAGLVLMAMSVMAQGQRSGHARDAEFGPVMQAYLGYLRNEQEVVDDRVSRREITASYYRRNSSRIRALREMAINLVTKSGNDYVPELEAVAVDELRTIFENPPNPRTFRVNQIVTNTFRYLGAVNTGDVFYVFARLDPYEQAALMESKTGQTSAAVEPPPAPAAKGQKIAEPTTRPRRTIPK